MMFGEQHLVRFGSMSKPAGSEALATLQDSDLEPPEVNAIPAWPPPPLPPQHCDCYRYSTLQQ